MASSLLDFLGDQGIWQQLDYFGRTSIARLFECCRKLLQLSMDQRAWRHLFRITGWDLVPNSARTILQEMTLLAAAKEIYLWSGFGSCCLSPTLAGLCTHATLIRAGFYFESGGAYVGAGAAWKQFFHQPQCDRLADAELERMGFEELECNAACGNLLSLPLHCRVTSPREYLGGHGRTSHNVKLNFQCHGYEFALNSKGKIYHTAKCQRSYASGAITVLQRGQGDLVTASWEYLWWKSESRAPRRRFTPWPFRVYRETDAKQLNTQLSNDVRVPFDSLDKFVLTGFAGQLKMCGGPFTPLLRHYGVLLFHLAIGMGLDDTDKKNMMLPFGDGLANW